MKIELNNEELAVLLELLCSDYYLENNDETIRESLVDKLLICSNEQTLESDIIDKDSIIPNRHNIIYDLIDEHLVTNFNDFTLGDFYMIRDSVYKLEGLLFEYQEIVEYMQLKLFPNHDLQCNLMWEHRNKTIH